jgi:hypothetical protein
MLSSAGSVECWCDGHKPRRAHSDQDHATNRERGAGQIASERMRGGQRWQRNDRLKHRRCRQEGKKDQGRQRDDVGNVGLSRSTSCRGLAIRWRRPGAPRRRPHNKAGAEENCEHRSTGAQNDRGFRYGHGSNLIADEMREEHRRRILGE